MSPRAAAFARRVVPPAGPAGRERARNLLWAAGKLADYGTGLGLEAVPEVLLHPSSAERFTRCAPGLSGVARRTLRTNLRFIGRRVVPQLYPADLPLPRERSKKPYSLAEISGFLALADAQPTTERRMRAAGLVCLGAGAGLIRGDLREVRGTDIACRSGGVLVTVRGPCPRAVPVLSRYQGRLLAAAASAGTGLICGGTDPGRRNITNPLITALDGGSRPAAAGHLPAAGDVAGRLRGAAGAGDVHARGRDQLLPAARRPRRRPGAGRGGAGGETAGGRPAMIPLAAAESVTGASGIAPRTEDMLPAGVRARQLSVRTLLLGMMLALADGRPAHLTRVHQALTSLPGDDQQRLGVLADWKDGPHRLTYRQAEYTFGLVTRALGKDQPDGQPPPALQRTCDDLLEAGIPEELKDAGTSLAVDWSDLETFSRPPPHGTSDCADPGASWGHRRNNLRHDEDELFFGYYLSAAVMVPGEQGPPVPELARRMTLSSCRHDPVPAFTPVLTAMPDAGIPLGDVLADSGYSHRIPRHWAAPLRAAGAELVQDLHPHDRGPKGTHARAPSSPTGTSTARKPRARCWNSRRSPAPPPRTRPPAMTRRPPRPPATSSAASPATTTTATTACSARRPWARSAARCSRHR